jgi:hypothetical protein
MTPEQIEKELLPVFFDRQLKKMENIRYFGVNELVSEVGDVVTDASIRFIKNLRSGDITFLSEKELYNLFAKYVNMSLKSHRSGRVIRNRDGSVVYPDSHFVSFAQVGDDTTEGFESSQTFEMDSFDVEQAVSALETNPEFEILKLYSLEGWGKYMIANKLGCSWKVAMNRVNAQRSEFISRYPIGQMV